VGTSPRDAGQKPRSFKGRDDVQRTFTNGGDTSEIPGEEETGGKGVPSEKNDINCQKDGKPKWKTPTVNRAKRVKKAHRRESEIPPRAARGYQKKKHIRLSPLAGGSYRVHARGNTGASFTPGKGGEATEGKSARQSWYRTVRVNWKA